MTIAAAPIVVVGDSHTSFFAGVEEVLPAYPQGPCRNGALEVHHVGPGLASSLAERESENNTRAKALDILSRHEPSRTSAVLLCFGEIDCRFHILRRLGKESSADPARLRQSAEVTAHRYMSFVLELQVAGFRPLVFGPLASTPIRYDEPFPWPTLGSTAERNATARVFERSMAGLCARSGVGYISVFEDLVDPVLETRAELYFDGVHLAQRAWPLFLKAARQAVPELEPEFPRGARAAEETHR